MDEKPKKEPMNYTKTITRILSVALTLLVLAGLCMAQSGSPSKPSAGQTSSKASASAAATDLIDINSASREPLSPLPGIDEVQEIIDGRP